MQKEILKGLTNKEKGELQLLRLLQADKRRWLSMWEFNRINELSIKAFEGAGLPDIPQSSPLNPNK
jgi:hypothetical protein